MVKLNIIGIFLLARSAMAANQHASCNGVGKMQSLVLNNDTKRCAISASLNNLDDVLKSEYPSCKKYVGEVRDDLYLPDSTPRSVCFIKAVEDKTPKLEIKVA